MKNISLWRQSKFEFKKNIFRASRDPKAVSISSRLAADRVAEYYQTYLKDHASGKLADLGCGKVPLYEAYKAFTTEIICADWENSLHPNPHLDVVCDLNKPLPLGDHEFDTVILSDVLEHLKDPLTAWNEMFRILKPSGKVIINVPFFYKLHEVPNDYYRYTKYALQDLAVKSGFTIILIKEIGGLPEVLADLTSKLIVGTPMIGKPLSMFIQYITKVFTRTGPGKRLSRKTQDHFPLGYFVVAQKPA